MNFKIGAARKPCVISLKVGCCELGLGGGGAEAVPVVSLVQWQFLYFFPLPQWQGSFLPVLLISIGLKKHLVPN
jgi:hypothetical protein